VEIVTFLAHSSGEWIKSVLDMPVVKSDPQGVGSAITYGRRYAYSGMVSVASEADDDGNAATGNRANGHTELMAEERMVELLDWMAAADTLPTLQKFYNTGYKEASDLKDNNSMKALIAAKDKRKAELQAQ
jgi:hypothetical protein